jgi:hypothetical protein
MAREDGLSVEQIAESLGLDVGLVAVALEQGAVGKEEKSEGQRALEAHFDSAVEALAELAIGAENEGVRAKAAMYLADVKLGLKKPREEVKSQGVVDINGLIKLAQSAYELQLRRAQSAGALPRAKVEGETIDV